jgi:3-deoxy-manno-octulosonate cytidylyltransferase (CMP-KDO synthetase)
MRVSNDPAGPTSTRPGSPSAVKPLGRTISCRRRHLGLYAYRVSALLALASAAPAALEIRERLAQLRALALGFAIVVADAEVLPGPGVDTPDDLARADAILRGTVQP